MIRTGAALGLVLWALGTSPAAGSGFAVEGTDRARLLAPAGASVSPYSNAGYRMEVRDGEVRIEVETTPLGSQSAFKPVERFPESGLGKVAHAVTAGAATEYDAVSRILGWIARSLDYEVDRQQPQTAEAVFERRSGYCTGVARLAVAMLASVGLEAREVAGWVVGSGQPGQAAGYHRWIEVHLTDIGWTFSDPLSSHHFVPATYVRLASEELVPESGLEGLLIERRDEVRPSDVQPTVAPGIRVRRNDDRRFAAALRVVVEGPARGLAVLEGSAVRRTNSLLEGETTFVGLEPGSYELRLLVQPGGWLARPVDLPGRAYKTLFLQASTVGDTVVGPRAER